MFSYIKRSPVNNYKSIYKGLTDSILTRVRVNLSKSVSLGK